MRADANVRFPPFPLSNKTKWVSRSHRNTQAAACSPIGKKEAAANKAAIATFSVWMNREAQAWADVLIAGLVKDLQPPATC